MTGELSVARWIREANFLLPSSCQVERFCPANSPPAPPPPPPPQNPFRPPCYSVSAPLSSIFVLAHSFLAFCSVLKPHNSITLPRSSLCPPALLIGWMYNVRLLGSTACREKARESTCHHWICVSFKKHICRQTTHQFIRLVKKSLPETAVRNVPRSETRRKRRERRKSKKEQVESGEEHQC